jgi:hypothetical protein
MEKKDIVRLSDAERSELKEGIRTLNGTSQKVRRAQILLKADADGPAWTDEKIADAFSCRVNTVAGIRQRLVEHGLEQTLNGKVREQPARPKCLDGNQDPKSPVLCMDEQPFQLVKEVRSPIDATKDHARRVDYEYERAGVANIFMFTEPLAGWRRARARVTKTNSAH